MILHLPKMKFRRCAWYGCRRIRTYHVESCFAGREPGRR